MNELSSPNKDCIQKNESYLKIALEVLNERERKAIFLRFWVPLSIFEISKEMHISWDQANDLIEKSLEKLRNQFFDFK